MNWPFLIFCCLWLAVAAVSICRLWRIWQWTRPPEVWKKRYDEAQRRKMFHARRAMLESGYRQRFRGGHVWRSGWLLGIIGIMGIMLALSAHAQIVSNLNGVPVMIFPLAAGTTNPMAVITTNTIPPALPPGVGQALGNLLMALFPTMSGPTLIAILALIPSLIQYARKAIPDWLQRNAFGKGLAAVSPEVNPTPGFVPTAVHPAETPSVVVPPPNVVPKTI